MISFSDELKHASVLTVILLIALSLQGCDATGDNAAQEEPEQEGVELAQEASATTLNDDFAAVADQISDFGGFYINDNGQPTVYLLDPSSGRRDEVRTALQDVFGEEILTRGESPRRTLESPQLQLREGTFRMQDLLAWYDELTEVLTLDGVTLLDLNERGNNLTIGVEDMGIAPDLEDRLTEFEVPGEAVEIVEVQVPQPDSHGLRSNFSPNEGGIEIGRTGTNIVCTMGFNVNYGGDVGFITNSHCTAQRGSVTGATFTNPGGGGQIGQESADPSYSSCALGTLSCRHSDAAFVDYNSGAGAAAEIARTQDWAAPNSGNGSRNIDHGSPSLDLRGVKSHPVSGEMVDKVGRTTGWTYGFVNRTCFRTPSGNGQGGIARANGRPVLLECQYRASYTSSGGDSGSPVFHWHGDEVTLLGIHWGSGPGGAIFSPFGGIQRDF